MKAFIKNLLLLLALLSTCRAMAAASCLPQVMDALAQARQAALSAANMETMHLGSGDAFAVLYNLGARSAGELSMVSTAAANPSEPPMLRAMLLEILGYWRMPELMPLVENSALQDNDSRVRQAALQALGSSGLPLAFNTLVNAWATESDPSLRAQVLLSLGSIGNQYAWQKIINEFKASLRKQNSSVDPETPGMFHMGPLLDGGQENQILLILADALDEDDYRVRMAAADCADLRRMKSMAQILRQALEEEEPENTTPSGETPGNFYENKVVKLRILKALRTVGDSSLESALLGLFQDENDDDVVAGYLDTLGALGTSACYPVLDQTLDFQDEFFVMHAAMAAQSLHATPLLPHIMQRQTTVKDPYVAGRLQQAVNALSH